MTADSWIPAAPSITTLDESFFTTADFVLPATIDLPHSPAQIWDALTGDRLGAWMPIIDRARWTDPPPRSRGARRTIRLLRRVTIDEEFHICDERRRLAFRALDIRPRVATAWAEQAQLGALPDDGTRLAYTVAINAPMLRPVPVPHPPGGRTVPSCPARHHLRPTRLRRPRITRQRNHPHSKGPIMTDSPSTPAQIAINLVGTYGNADAMADALAENGQWWISPSTPPDIMASLSTGREVVRGNMQRVFSLIYKPGTVSTTVHHAIGEGDLATIRFTMHAQLPNGAPYENEYTDWIETRDGQIIKVWEYVDAAWAAAVMAAGGIDVSAAMGTAGT